MRFILTALLMFAFASQAAAEYKRISSPTWWQTANVFDVIEELASGVDVMEPNSENWYAIHAASLYGDFSAFEMIVEATTDFSMHTDMWGTTPLMFAALSERDALQKVKFLLDVGADVTARDHHGNSALHHSMNNSTRTGAEIAEVLLTVGADVTARTKTGDTPLHRARTSDQAQVLLSNGANVMPLNKYDYTPLHSVSDSVATEQGVIEALLAAGANPHAKDKSGNDPWYYVELRGHLKGTKSYWALNDARFN